ncbi:MAG: hypothetical protein ACXVAY_22760, partial [Mucilaginibacter sp.]
MQIKSGVTVDEKKPASLQKEKPPLAVSPQPTNTAQPTPPSLRGTKQSLHMQIKTGINFGKKKPAAIAVKAATWRTEIASYLAM